MASESSFTIPQDLIIYILYRLPAKSLGRFRCVSKDWLSLLSEPKFIKSHINILSRNHLFFRELFSSYSLPFNYHQTLSRPTEVDLLTIFTPIQSPSNTILNHHPSNFHGSCNGLVLASGVSGDLVVFNPTTRDFIKLPKSRFNDMVYGFGYDSVTDDYKVVAMPYTIHRYYCCLHSFNPHHHHDLENHVHVYSLRTNAWRQVIKSDHAYRKNMSGVLVNGFLHWIGSKQDSSVIVAFCLADEKLNDLLSFKDVNIIFVTECYLVALGEKLAIFNGMKGEIWLMNEYGVRSSWTKIVVHGFSETRMVNPKIFNCSTNRPMIFYDNGKIMFVQHNRMI